MMRKILIALCLSASPVYAATALTLYDTQTTNYFQLFPGSPLSESYQMSMPKSTGTVGQILEITGVTGSSITTSWVTGSGSSSSGGGTTWGSITGTLSSQSDLESVLSSLGSSTGTLSVSTASLQSQINGLGSTYLTQSSATATYLQGSSATATYLQIGAAASTYLTQATAAANYLLQSSAASTYLAQSSATATYLQSSSATATYFQKTATIPVANGGTGTSSPGLVAGTNISSITGTWPNQTINAANQGGVGGGLTYSSFTASPPILYNNATGAFSLSPISLSTGVTGALPAASVAPGSLGASVIASSITLGAMYGAPTLTGTNFSALPGAQVGAGVPAANIASGSLGASVIGSSLNASVTYNVVVATANALSFKVSVATGIAGILPVANGGSGSATPALVAGTNINISGSWPNQTISDAGSGLTYSSFTANPPIVYNNTTGAFTLQPISLSSAVVNILPIANGGNGTAFPAITAGTNINVSGSWPTQTIAANGSGLTFSSFTATQPILYSNGVLSATLISLSTGVVGSLPAASIAGGSLGATVIASSLAATSGSLAAGTNITSITGSWPNLTINAATQGGSGITAGSSTTWTSSQTYTYNVLESSGFKTTGTGPFLFSDNGTDGTTLSTGTLDVYRGNTYIGATLFTVGSINQTNIFRVQDSGPALMTQFGAQIGGLQEGYSGSVFTITTNQSSQSLLNLWNSGEVDLQSANSGQGGKDIVFLPQTVEGLRLSNSNGIIATSSATFKNSNGVGVTYNINVGSMTGAGLSTCGSASTALGWTGGLYNCNTITPAGIGAITGNQTITLSGDSTGSGATSIAVTAAATQANIRTFSGPITDISSHTMTAGLSLNGGFSVTSNVRTGAYTALNTDTVILASSTFSSISTVTLPSAASNPGLIISYWKVDGDTAPTVLLGNGSDVINGTGTYKFYSRRQGGTLQSDGISGWNTYGTFQTNPPFIGYAQTTQPAIALAASSNTVSLPAIAVAPTMVCFYRINVGTSGGGTGLMNLATYDGTTGNLIESTGNMADTTTGWQNIAVTPFFVAPGPLELALQANNTVFKFAPVNGATQFDLGGYAQTATSMTLPNPLSFAATTTQPPNIILLPCGGPWTQ